MVPTKEAGWPGQEPELVSLAAGSGAELHPWNHLPMVVPENFLLWNLPGVLVDKGERSRWWSRWGEAQRTRARDSSSGGIALSCRDFRGH